MPSNAATSGSNQEKAGSRTIAVSWSRTPRAVVSRPLVSQ